MVVERQKQHASNNPVAAGLMVFLFLCGIFYFDFATGFNGYDVTSISFLHFIGALLTAPTMAFLFFYILKNWGNKTVMVSTAFLTTVFIFAGLLNIRGPNWIRIFLLFILYEFFAKPLMEDDQERSRENWMFGVFILLDYVFFGVLDIILSGDVVGVNRLFFPLHFLYFMRFYLEKTGHTFFALVLALILAFSVFSVAGGRQAFLPGFDELDQSQKDDFAITVHDFFTDMRNAPTNIQSFINDTVTAITDPYNEGEKKETPDPQGVTVVANRDEMVIRPGSTVAVFGQILPNSLDFDVPVRISCTLESDEWEPIQGKVSKPQMTVRAARQSFSCRFPALHDEGEYEVVLAAEYDFVSSVGKEIYLMEVEEYDQIYENLRTRGMENPGELDILREKGYTNLGALSESSTGPLHLTLDSQEYIWFVGNPADLDLFMKNDADGEIVTIREVTMKVPRDVEFTPDTYPEFREIQGSDSVFNWYQLQEPILSPAEEEQVTGIIAVSPKELGGRVTKRNVLATVEYTYRDEDAVTIRVEGDKDGPSIVDEFCCEISRNGQSTYSWEPSSQACADRASQLDASFDIVSAIDCYVCCEYTEDGKTSYDEAARCEDTDTVQAREVEMLRCE